MKRVLVIKMWALGDILMATPLLTALHANFPGVHVSWLVDAQNADLLAGHPLVEDVVVLDTHSWRRRLRHGNVLAWASQAGALRAQMRRKRFDAVINCHPDKWWTASLCVAPVRVALYPSPRLPLSRLAYTHILGQAKGAHNTDEYLQTLSPLGLPGPHDRHMSLAVSDDARRAAHSFLAQQRHYNPAKPLVVLHPGTSQQAKCWPPGYYAALAARLTPSANVVLTGSPAEAALARQVAAAVPPGLPPPIVAAGALPSLRQTIALVAQADAVVTGDTGILHIASALGVPLVGIYGSTRPADNAPLFGPQALLFDDTVPCAPCYQARCPLPAGSHLRCLHAVAPAQALAALHALAPHLSFSRSVENFYESRLA